MSKNKEYWQDRFIQLQEAQLNKGEKYYSTLDKQYRKAIKNIENDISRWYVRFAENNEINMAEAKQLLNSKELDEFRWDVEEYIKHGKENSLNQQWMKQLENASTRVHISRLEALKLQIQQQAEVIYGNKVDGIDKLARDIYTDGYYHTAYEIQKGFNIGWDLQALNNKQIDMVISKPWAADGNNFSSRLWKDKNNLISILHAQLSQAIIRGDAPHTAIKVITKQMNANKQAVARLVMTESAYFASASQKDCFNDFDVEKYEIVATLDSHTSAICQKLDGKVLDMKDYQSGVTAPPFHCWCRTVTVPFFDDDYGERIARDYDGKTYYVPSNLTYNEWRKKYIVNKYGESESKILEKKLKNEYSDKNQYKKYKVVLGNQTPKTFDKFQDLKYNDIEAWGQLKGDFRKLNAYNKIIANEPEITKDLKDISKSTGVKMVGLEYRLKTKESYLRKVGVDSKNSLDSKVIDEVISSTNDVIRYTYQADYKNLVSKYDEVNKELTNKGYKQTKMKNTWLIKSNPYKGINCSYRSPDGQVFEVQFHTPESFELKNGVLHKLYERWRSIQNKASSEAVALSREMAELSGKLKYPERIKELR